VDTTLQRKPLEITRLSGAIGAVIRGADLRRPLHPEDAARIGLALTEHHVVFFRDQLLRDTEQCALASQFGDLAVSPIHELIGSDQRVSIIEDTPQRPPAGFDWHTDLSWTASPPRYGFLSALDIPAFGGDTLWASLAATYEALSPSTREICEGLRIVHRFDASLLASVERHHGQVIARRLVDEHPPVEHPLVTVDPTSGRHRLFLSPLYSERIIGLPRAEGDRLLADLQRAIEDPHTQIRWRWKRGDVAIWDESATCHRALTDHFPQTRKMRRCVST
jgi:taurine dioxygenase